MSVETSVPFFVLTMARKRAAGLTFGLVLALLVSDGSASSFPALSLREGKPFSPSSLRLRRVQAATCMATPAFADNPGTMAKMLGIPDVPVDGMAIFGGGGFILGFCVKKMGKAAVGVVAALGIGEKIMESNGYITVHWDKIHADMTKSGHLKWLDQDGDGKFTLADVTKLLSNGSELFKETVEQNTRGLGVAGSSFATGVAAGFIAG